LVSNFLAQTSPVLHANLTPPILSGGLFCAKRGAITISTTLPPSSEEKIIGKDQR
jgi:hypothetical protein